MTKHIILVVDDEPMNRSLAEMVLNSEGYETIFAQNGQEAIDALSCNSVDAILMDVMMPVMDGFEATRRIKADDRYRDIPLIIVTAASDKGSLKTGLTAGANEFLAKPYDIEELKLRIKNMLQLKMQSDALKASNVILEERVQQRTAQLREALEAVKNSEMDIIQILGRASEFRDNDTGAHILRMSNYAAVIARHLGLNEDNVQLLLAASPMHDVGKIGIPDSILLKPGKLTSEEFEEMKKHAVIGSQILSHKETPLLKAAKIIALTHHEKWDGTGYPYGTAGEEIPLFGRITAVADVFDALVSERPYKKAFSIEATSGIIQEGSGVHFDPNIVGAFFGCLPQILDMRERLNEH